MSLTLKYFKSGRCCSVPQCKSKYTSQISLFLFPSDKRLQKKWAQALRIGKKITKYMYVCNSHFVKSDFTLSIPDIPVQRRRLKKGVIPSQNQLSPI
ncbi:hypothetical protein ABEB36_004714 [Hypothenemus hampei]|uniref:THAP-type domain-containing protein n=1 Tax=Hypothenemus hampei TaxID=57062 RepID=A0ABD1F475_HYPHA